MADNEWIKVDSILMTSEPIAAYGGIAIAPEVLASLAADLGSKVPPMHVDHDLSRPLRIRNSRAWVEERADGIHVLHMDYEIHRSDWQLAGERRGMSTTVHSPIPGRTRTSSDDPLLDFAADHAWFEDQALLLTEDALIDAGFPVARVRVERAFQFSAVPDPQLFITFVPALLTGVATGVLGNMLWDGIKVLLRRRRTPNGGVSTTATVVNLQVIDGDRSLVGVVRTNDEAIAERAMVTFETEARNFINTSSPQGTRTETGDVTEHRIVAWNDEAASWTAPN